MLQTCYIHEARTESTPRRVLGFVQVLETLDACAKASFSPPSPTHPIFFAGIVGFCRVYSNRSVNRGILSGRCRFAV